MENYPDKYMQENFLKENASKQFLNRLPKLRIFAFGEPIVFINDMSVVHWRMSRAMEVCLFLLNYSRPIRKERIMSILWPNEEKDVDQTLRSTIYYIRKIMGKSCILYRAGAYELNLTDLDNNYWYDVALFEQYYSQAQQALLQKDKSTARACLKPMVDLYRGDYVESFYSNWCIPRRDELRRIYMNARRELAVIAWYDEQIEESIYHWQQILAVDNCFEEAHYGLMCCYIRQNNRIWAIRQYQLYTEILQKELSVTPGMDIQKLYYQLVFFNKEKGTELMNLEMHQLINFNL